jgi:hypothetical protein
MGKVAKNQFASAWLTRFKVENVIPHVPFLILLHTKYASTKTT